MGQGGAGIGVPVQCCMECNTSHQSHGWSTPWCVLELIRRAWCLLADAVQQPARAPSVALAPEPATPTPVFKPSEQSRQCSLCSSSCCNPILPIPTSSSTSICPVKGVDPEKFSSDCGETDGFIRAIKLAIAPSQMSRQRCFMLFPLWWEALLRYGHTIKCKQSSMAHLQSLHSKYL